MKWVGLAKPLNLVAEVAKDSSGEDASARGVLLQWLKPLAEAGFDDPEGYAIQVSTDDGLNWESTPPATLAATRHHLSSRITTGGRRTAHLSGAVC